MRPGIILAFCAFFVLGLALGYVVFSSQKSEGIEESVEPAQIRPASSAAPQAEGIKRAARPLSYLRGERPGDSEDLNRKLSSVLSELPEPEVEAGDGSISGRILTREGWPLPNAVVFAAKNRARESVRKLMRPPEERPLEEEVLDYVVKRRWERSTKKKTKSDEEGKFILNGLALQANYRVQAYLDGYSIKPIQWQQARKAKPGMSVDFRAEVRIEIPVQVLLPDGKPAFSARIEYSKGSGGVRRSSSSVFWDKDYPTVLMPPGSYTVRALHEEEDECCSDSKELTITEDQEPEKLTFQLKGRSGIKGRVVFPEGEELESLQVYLLRFAQGTPPSLETLKEDGEQKYVYVGKGFSYAFPDLSPGMYLLGASRTYSGPIVLSSSVEVRDDSTTHDLLISPLKPSEYAVVWVYGPRGEVLRDVSISTGVRSRFGSSTGGRTVIKRKNGSFWVLHHEKDEDSLGRVGGEVEHIVKVESSQYGEKEVTYFKRETSEVTVHFKEPATVEITIAGYAGSGYEGKISLGVKRVEKGKDEPLFMRSGMDEKPDAEGRQTFGPMEPGAYEIILAVKTDRYSTMPVDWLPVELQPGMNRTTLSMPRFYSLTVLVEEPGKEKAVRLRPVASSLVRRWSSWEEELDEGGRAVFECLPAGTYKISSSSNYLSGEMTVVVPDETFVRFEPKSQNAMQVTITDSSGDLATAGFQTGDLIIGMDGKDFENMMQMASLLTGAMSKQEVALTVFRNGQTIEIRIDPKKLMMLEKDPGGRMEPTSR